MAGRVFELIDDNRRTVNYNFELQNDEKRELYLAIFAEQPLRVKIDVRLAEKAEFLGRVWLFGRKAREIKLDYFAQHDGAVSKSNFEVFGVLSESCRKSSKMKIDFKRGAIDAQGNEHETVVLLDEGCRNRCVPIINCSEERVSGKHGMGCGALDEKGLEYLRSRGVKETVGRKLLLRAKINEKMAKLSEDEIQLIEKALERFYE